MKFGLLKSVYSATLIVNIVFHMALINISGLSTNYQSTRKKIHVNCLCV